MSITDSYYERNPYLGEYELNYRRDGLRLDPTMPIILVGTCARIYEKHVTFTAVSPYIRGQKTWHITNHLCITRSKIEECMDITTLSPGTRYFMIGYPHEYRECDRMGLHIALDLTPQPIISVNDWVRRPIIEQLLPKCAQFDLNTYKYNPDNGNPSVLTT